MSAILSADDLNDFISPGVACIKPVETLPKEPEPLNPYEVTTEDKLQAVNPAPASISLTDCLACSGCVTSAEAVLISLQSHTEVLTTLDAHPSLDVGAFTSSSPGGSGTAGSASKVFVASVSPQVRASLAATYNITESQAGRLIEQFLSGPQGLRSGGQNGSYFSYVVDTNRMRAACLHLAAEEVAQSRDRVDTKSQPVLTSACPGWICFAEKTHPQILPYLSKLKSPQALTGTLLKSVLSKSLGVRPSQIWHLAIMPCFDKKLEASRGELTDRQWAGDADIDSSSNPVRDVDCVITSRELLSLASDRGLDLTCLPLTPLPKQYRPPFPHPLISRFLFPKPRRRNVRLDNDNDHSNSTAQSFDTGTSGGYLHHILHAEQSLYPGSTVHSQRGRNADVVEYTLVDADSKPLFKCARFYGFRNIQNLVRKLKPARPGRLPGAAARRKTVIVGKEGSDYAYVEVMACPGGCTNGGGQIRADEAVAVQMNIPSTTDQRETRGGHETDEQKYSNDIDSTEEAVVIPPARPPPPTQREWLRRVDSAYFSASSSQSSSSSSSASSPSSLSSPPSSPRTGPSPASSSSSSSDNNHDHDHDHDHDNEQPSIQSLLTTWSTYTAIPRDRLVYTTFHGVESDVGKTKDKDGGGGVGDMERVARLAGSIGGGW